LVGGWGTGTGFAGVFSNILYLLTSSNKVNDAFLFFPLLIIELVSYWGSFIWLDNRKGNF
jgi:hypothetical protein